MIRDRNKFILLNVKGKVLDVGCFESTYFQKEWTGLDIKNGFDLNKKKLPKGYDTIILGEILEHVNNPYGLLKQVWNSLNFNGRLILTTPNCRTFNYNWDSLRNHPEHLYTWDLVLIKRLISRVGFNVVFADYCGKLSPISNKSWHLVVIAYKREVQNE